MSQSSGGFGGQESQRFAPPSQRATGQQGTPQQPTVPGQPGRWVPQGSQPQGQGSQYGQAGGPGQYGASYPSGQPGSFGQSGSYGAGGGAGSYPGVIGGQAPSSGQFAGYGQSGSYGAGAYPGGPVGPGQPPAGGAFGSGPSGRRGFPVWGWVLVAVAAVGVVVGILFAAGVFGGGDKEADPTPTPSTTVPEPDPTPTTPDPTPTTPDPTPSTPAAEKVNEHTARVGDMTIELLELTPDATSVLDNAKASEVYEDLDEGEKLIGLKVRVTNEGSTTEEYPVQDVVDPILVGSDGFCYYSFSYYSDESFRKLRDLGPGQSAEAMLYYAVPQDFDIGRLVSARTGSWYYYQAEVELELP